MTYKEEAMATIQMEYREGHCKFNNAHVLDCDYSEQCHTVVAGASGCRYFNDGSYTKEDGTKVIGCGACIHAYFKTIYKGVSVKKYEMEEYTDAYNPWLNCMIVTIGKKEYECTEVILDGKQIYGGENDRT